MSTLITLVDPRAADGGARGRHDAIATLDHAAFERDLEQIVTASRRPSTFSVCGIDSGVTPHSSAICFHYLMVREPDDRPTRPEPRHRREADGVR